MSCSDFEDFIEVDRDESTLPGTLFVNKQLLKFVVCQSCDLFNCDKPTGS